jgi:hypothetical protein
MVSQETESTNTLEKNQQSDTAALLKIILKKWWLFAVVTILAGIGGIVYATMQVPKYESDLTFALDAGSTVGTLSGAMNLAAQFGIGSGSGLSMFDGDNILEIMKSRRMVETVLLTTESFDNHPYTLVQYFIEKLDMNKELGKKATSKKISFPVGVKKNELTYLQDSFLYCVYNSFVKNNLAATRPDKKLSIYEVKVTSMNEKFSKIFTDRIVQETSSYYKEITSKKDKETLDILEERVAFISGNIGKSIDSRAVLHDANLNPAMAQTESPGVKQQYNIQAYSEAYKEMFKTLEMARYQYLKKIPLLQIIDNADYPMKKIKTSKLKAAAASVIVFNLLAIIVLMLMINFKRSIEN